MTFLFSPDPRIFFHFNDIVICKRYHELHRGKKYSGVWIKKKGVRWCAPLFPVMTLTLNSDRSSVYARLGSEIRKTPEEPDWNIESCVRRLDCNPVQLLNLFMGGSG